MIRLAAATTIVTRMEMDTDVTFTIEFIRVRESDHAHATLDRITDVASDLEEAKVRAKSLFATLDLPQQSDALRILDEEGREMFFWSPDAQPA